VAIPDEVDSTNAQLLRVGDLGPLIAAANREDGETPNARLTVSTAKRTITIQATRTIRPNQELLLAYGSGYSRRLREAREQQQQQAAEAKRVLDKQMETVKPGYVLCLRCGGSYRGHKRRLTHQMTECKPPSTQPAPDKTTDNTDSADADADPDPDEDNGAAARASKRQRT